MIFHDASARNVSDALAREIVGALPPFVTPVGVFVDTPISRIIELAVELSLQAVQLNGDYDGGDVITLAGAWLRPIEAVRVEESTLAARVRGINADFACAILLETAGTDQPGGTGVANDWALVRRHQALGTFKDAPPLIAAGGLTAHTVGEVVQTIRPWAVDVSSGVEGSTKGVKDEAKIAEFIAAVRAADHTGHSDPLCDDWTDA
jgi:phosphoribosylanthranilate isomerase